MPPVHSAAQYWYRIDPSRSQQAAKALLGEDFASCIITDRYAGYHWLDVLQQQLCCAHLICQVTEISAPTAPPARTATTSHAGRVAAAAQALQALLKQGPRGRHHKTSRLAAGLLSEFDARWTFCEVPGIDPTNNAAERALRHGVIMRNTQLGTRSQIGNRWIKRICSARDTCMLQRRSVPTYLIDAATAAHHGQPIPSLAPT
jgi:transposase